MYEIRGKYPGEPWETIDTADSVEEARFLVHEYQMAYGPEWSLCYRRARA